MGYPRKNILNSLLWLTGITFSAGTLSLTFGEWPQSLIPMVMAIISFFFTLWYYRFWANRDPDRLQTEEFRIQRDFVAKLPDRHLFSEQQIPPEGAKRLTRSEFENE